MAGLAGLGGYFGHGGSAGVGGAMAGEGLIEGLRRLLPNLGAKYVGRQAGAAFPEPLQKVLDLAVQKAVDQNRDTLIRQGRSLIPQQ